MGSNTPSGKARILQREPKRQSMLFQSQEIPAKDLIIRRRSTILRLKRESNFNIFGSENDSKVYDSPRSEVESDFQDVLEEVFKEKDGVEDLKGEGGFGSPTSNLVRVRKPRQQRAGSLFANF